MCLLYVYDGDVLFNFSGVWQNRGNNNSRMQIREKRKNEGEGKSHSLATTTKDSTGCKYLAIKPKKYAFFHYNSLNNAIKLSS